MVTAPEKETPTQRLRREKWGWNNLCVDLQIFLRSGWESISRLTEGHQEKTPPSNDRGKWCIVVQLIVRLRLRGSSRKTPPSSGGEKWCIDLTPDPTFETFFVFHFISQILQYLPVLFFKNSTTSSQSHSSSRTFRWYSVLIFEAFLVVGSVSSQYP